MTEGQLFALALVLGLAVGFVLAVAFMAWATKPEAAKPEATPTHEKPANVRASFKRLGGGLALRLYLNGLTEGFGTKLDQLAIQRHSNSPKAQQVIDSGGNAIALLCARAYADGVTELRAALAENTGIEGRMLDQAFELAMRARRETLTKERSA